MSIGFVTAPVKGQVTVLGNFLYLGGGLLALFSEQCRLLGSVLSFCPLLVAISLLVFVIFAWDAVRHIKYAASFVLQCKDSFYCSQCAFKFETTRGTSFLLCLLENEIAHKTVEFAHVTCATSCADKSPWSHAFWPKENDAIIFLGYSFLDIWLESSIFTEEILTRSCVRPLRSWTKHQHKAQWMGLTVWGESAEEHDFAVCG